MSHAASINASAAAPDVAQEVMSRLAAQVLQMGQQRFEQMLQQPQEQLYDYSDIGDDEEDEDGDGA